LHALPSPETTHPAGHVEVTHAPDELHVCRSEVAVHWVAPGTHAPTATQFAKVWNPASTSAHEVPLAHEVVCSDGVELPVVVEQY
jgi:hypothetical protein